MIKHFEVETPIYYAEKDNSTDAINNVMNELNIEDDQIISIVKNPIFVLNHCVLRIYYKTKVK